jgi:hypothetical protein
MAECLHQEAQEFSQRPFPNILLRRGRFSAALVKCAALGIVEGFRLLERGSSLVRLLIL